MDGAYAERFGGIGRLYGQAGLERFQKACVMVVGVGGVGSWTAEALGRSGIGHITLVDLDDICVTNMNRQLHALDTTIGSPKVAAMAQRLRLINPALELRVVNNYYGERTVEECFAEPLDVVVDAIDSVRQKAHLLAEARRRGIAAVSVGGAGGRIDPTRIRVEDLSRSGGDRLLLQVRKRLRTDHAFPAFAKGKTAGQFGIRCVFSDEPPLYPWSDGSLKCEREPGSQAGLHCDAGFGSATHVTASMGLFAAGEVLKLLAGGAES